MKQKNHTIHFRHKLPVILLFLLLLSPRLAAQVTIGDGTPPQNYSILEIVSNSKGGIRLPHLTTAERDALRDGEAGPAFASDPARVAPFLYEGLTIYNTTTRCVEYYNAHRWISMCDGNSQMTISPQPCTAINADGTGCDNEFEITDPDCTNGPFNFAIITGSDYAYLEDVDEADGTFRISFQSNNSINSRSAIVRVTSSCTALYKDFMFSQLGQACDPLLGSAPSITSVPAGKNISFCSGGAVYLSVPANTPNLGELIWTRNGTEVARGVNSLTVTQAGIYDVWMGLIGCGQLANNAVTVTRNGTGAPSPVEIVVKGNNGMVCDINGTCTLIANTTSTGTVRWFKDGILQELTSPDNRVEAGIGRWFAVVTDGSQCWSTPSETVIVSPDPNTGAQLTKPGIGKGGTFCAGSSVQLSVNDNYDPSNTYTWYENNTQIGTGQYIVYSVPTNTNSVVIRCRATRPGSCAAEAITEENITIGTIPERPSITGNSVLCSGAASLSVIPDSPGNYTYAWYKDSQLIGTSQTINIISGGNYYSCVTESGGCTSPLAHRQIPEQTSAAPTVTLSKSSDNPNLNDVVTYVASINFGPATGYTWTSYNATLLSGGGGTPNAVFKFESQGDAWVKVEVSNDCGIGTATHQADIKPKCADLLSVHPNSTTSFNTVEGIGQTLGPVSATFSAGSPSVNYQWYKNSSESNSGGNLINGATGSTYIVNGDTGTHYYYCEVSNGNTGCGNNKMASGVYKVVISANPGSMTLGSGTFKGITCFDINKSNFLDGCGSEAGRAGSATNFATLGDVIYTFTASASGTKSDLRFVVVDPESVIDSWTGAGISGTIANNQTATLSIKYKTTLSDVPGLIYGRTREQAAKVRLYAVYNDGTKDVSVPLTVSIQDCICCPGYLAIGGEYVQTTSGYLTGVGEGEKIKNVLKFFTATGKDVCFYKRDGHTNLVTWNTASPKCKNGTYIDAEHHAMGSWRLPTLAELGVLQSIHKNLSIQPTSTPDTENMKSSLYWASTEQSPSLAIDWYFGSGVADIVVKNGTLDTAKGYTRCVRTFE